MGERRPSTLKTAARALRTAASQRCGGAYEEEVLVTRVDGAPLTRHLDDFFRLVLAEGQKTYERVHQAIDVVDRQYPPEGVDRALLRRELSKHIARSPWGDDPRSVLFWTDALLDPRHFF